MSERGPGGSGGAPLPAPAGPSFVTRAGGYFPAFAAASFSSTAFQLRVPHQAST
jgi:hypothetical protein